MKPGEGGWGEVGIGYRRVVSQSVNHDGTKSVFPAPGRLKEKDPKDQAFRVVLGYTASLKLAWAT